MSIDSKPGIDFAGIETEFSTRKRDGISFAEAAELSLRQYHTPEERADRLAAVQHLETTMIPGEPVMHRVSGLNVRAGILLEPPEITEVMVGHKKELAISFTYGAHDEVRQSEVLVKHLGAQAQLGGKKRIPRVVAGREDVSAMALEAYVRRRAAEVDEGVARWANTDRMAELYVYEALAQTDIRLDETLTADEMQEVRGYLAQQAAEPHLAPLVERASGAVGDGEGQPNIEIRHESAWRRRSRAAMGAVALFLSPGKVI